MNNSFIKNEIHHISVSKLPMLKLAFINLKIRL